MKYKKIYESDRGEDLPIYSRRILEMLNQRKMTMKELASVSGISAAAISEWINGKKTPRNENLTAVANALNVSLDFLTGISSVKTPDTDLQGVCKFTGLSENAVANILKIKNMSDPDYIKTLSYILENLNFLDIVKQFVSANDCQDILEQNDEFVVSNIGHVLESLGKPNSKYDTYIQKIARKVEGSGLRPFFKQQLFECISRLFDERFPGRFTTE